MVKNLPAIQETGFNPWVGRFPWNRKCNPLQYSCLENPMDRRAWRATVHGVDFFKKIYFGPRNATSSLS